MLNTWLKRSLRSKLSSQSLAVAPSQLVSQGWQSLKYRIAYCSRMRSKKSNWLMAWSQSISQYRMFMHSKKWVILWYSRNQWKMLSIWLNKSIKTNTSTKEEWRACKSRDQIIRIWKTFVKTMQVGSEQWKYRGNIRSSGMLPLIVN